MAEKEAAAPAPVEAAPAPSGGQKPILFIILAIVNMLVVVSVGFMLYKAKQQEAKEPGIKDVIRGEHDTHTAEESAEKAFVGKVVPLETFIVNMAQSKGRKVVKVNMELELDEGEVAGEIEKRKPQIRDIIIITLSSKTFDEVSSREGKENLRTEIKDTINNFLTKGKIRNVFFTEFIYN